MPRPLAGLLSVAAALLAVSSAAAQDEPQQRDAVIVAMGEDGPLDAFADIDALLAPPPTPTPSTAQGLMAAPPWLSDLLQGPAAAISQQRVAQLLNCNECMTPGVWPAPAGMDMAPDQLTNGGPLGIPGALRIASQGEPQLLPSGIIFRPYLADPKESRMGTAYRYERDDGWLWDHSLGGRFGLLRFGNRDFVYPQGVQLDLEGAAQLRQDPEADMQLRSADYRFGLPLTFGYGRHRTKLAYYHLSSHLGDEFLLSGGGPRVNYVRDAMVLAHAIYLWPSVRVYAEADWAFNTDVSEPWHFQFGADYSPARGTSGWGAPFAAVNGRIREEIDYSGGVSAQAGWAWRSRYNGRLLRLGAHYYYGKSSQYSFFSQHEQLIGLGLWLDN